MGCNIDGMGRRMSFLGAISAELPDPRSSAMESLQVVWCEPHIFPMLSSRSVPEVSLNIFQRRLVSVVFASRALGCARWH